MSRRASLSLDGAEWSIKGYLGDEWRMRRAFAPDTGDVHGWTPARVPGSVLDDLVRAGAAPDPRVDLNSLATEWVAQRSWVYRRKVAVEHDGAPVELHFDGIDHAARVFVNGIAVGEHTGAFTPAVFDVTDAIQDGPNLVAVVLAPAPEGEPQCGDTSRVRTGKSRMTYGWDFCPRIVHLGIWDRARLEFPASVRIVDLFARPQVIPGRPGATLRWQFQARATHPGTAGLTVELVRADDPAGTVISCDHLDIELDGADRLIAGELAVTEPQLWWPNGYGAQPLYRLRARLAAPGEDGRGQGEDTADVTTAFRSADLAANNDSPGEALPYTFVVNGERIYVQGWNWTPMDVHHGVPDGDRLHHLLGLAARAGVNLLRVWGGGLIEKADFYHECDRLGIMVWQEFPLSSSLLGSVPSDDPEYVTTMADDARRIVPRRRNHPSLVVWCGGNELEEAGGTPSDGSQPVLRALRTVVTELDPDRAWLPTSPTGPIATCTLAAVQTDPDGQHDVHGPWEHQGLTAQRTLYDRATSLLHSEFGVEGMSNIETIEAFVGEPHRWPADRSNPHVVHRGDFWVNAPLLADIFGPFDDLGTMVAASQFLQADGLRYAVEANRRRQWRQCGSIPWQLAEPFPNVYSTSAVDYAGRPKAAYYAVAEAYAAILVSARVPTQAWTGRDRFEATIWVSSRRERLPAARVEARLLDAAGTVLHVTDRVVDVAGGGSAEVAGLAWPVPDVPLFWLDLVLLDRDGEMRSRTRYLNASGADLTAMRALPPPRLDVRWAAPGRLAIRNTGTRVAVGVRARDARPVSSPGYAWFDAGNLTLFPGEEGTIGTGWIGATADGAKLVVEAWSGEPIVHV